MDLNQVVDTAFNLDYLGTQEFPETELNDIVILGGGTAGYLTALALKKARPKLNVRIIESSKIPVIGVGESTTTEIIPFLHRFLGFDPVSFFEEVKPTLKLGIKFDWGKADTPAFNFNFFAGHLWENLYYKKHTGSFNWPSDLMYKEKIPVIGVGENGTHSFLNSVPFSYHLDNKSLIQYLKKQISAQSIEILDKTIESAVLSPEGLVEGLKTDESEIIKAKLYIDCSGFKSLLLGQSLKEEFVDYSDSLMCDTAITFNIANNGNISPYTEAISMNAGWCWRIPMREEDHLGYVFSSQYLSDDEALKEIEERFGKIESYKKIPFKSGRYTNAFSKNVFAVGNSYAFIEPLESTAIQTLIQSIMLLNRLFPKSLEDSSSIESLNKEVSENWDSFKAFLAVHYKFNEKVDSKFWKEAREQVKLDRAEKIIKLYQYKAPLSYSHFGNSSGFSALEDLVFNSYSYDSLLMGQELIPENLPQPRFSEEELDYRLSSYNNLSEIAFSQFEAFKNQEAFIQNVWLPLFQEEDSWINETFV
jgi:tryptophan halogenase